VPTSNPLSSSSYLESVLLLELEVLLPEGVDSINHDLDQLDLGVAKTMLVGDVISVSSLTEIHHGFHGAGQRAPRIWP